MNNRLPASKTPNSVPEGFGLQGASAFILQQKRSPQVSGFTAWGRLAFKLKKQIVAITKSEAGSSFDAILFMSGGFQAAKLDRFMTIHSVKPAKIGISQILNANKRSYSAI